MFVKKLEILNKLVINKGKSQGINLLFKNKRMNDYFIRRRFCSKKEENAKPEEKAEEKSELERELEETEEERLARTEREEKKKMLNAVYTQEELAAINESGREIVFMEIKEANRKKLYLAKRLSIYFNIPLSIALMFLIDYLFGDTTEIKPSKKPLYYLSLGLDYLLFLNGITILAGCRNIVLLAKYIPKEKAIEFTKLSLFAKPFKVKEQVDHLRRVGAGSMTPFISLKNKTTNAIYSMNSVGIWKDRKLYNALYPPPIRKTKGKKEGAKFLDI